MRAVVIYESMFGKLPRPSTRSGAPDYVRKSDGHLEMQPGAEAAAGVREWLSTLDRLRIRAAAFDTKVGGPGFLTGRASKGIARRLEEHGAVMVGAPQSFLVKGNRLLPGELERASRWGERLASELVRSSAAAPG